MPQTKKFKKLLKATKKYYGSKKGISVAYAIAAKHHWRA